MLKKLEQHTKELLELADFIDGLDPDRFDIGSWGQWQEPRCICGWYLHNKGYFDKSDWPQAARMLGLERETAHALFHSGKSKDDAVKQLRSLALTGEMP